MSYVERKIEKKKIKFPHAFVILFWIIAICTILTYIVPAGQFNRVEIDGKVIVEANSFQNIQQTPVSIFEMFKAIPTGIQSASSLMIMILLIGASIRVFDSTGAIKSLLLSIINKIGTDKKGLVLVAIMIFFGCLGAFPGMLEAAIPFAPLCIGIALSLGYDVIVGISIALIPIAIGWTSGPTNPWNVGIGQSLANLPMFSGIGYRMIIFTVFMTVSIIYVLRYASKISKNPSKSVVYKLDTSGLEFSKEENNNDGFTTSQKITLLIFLLTIVVIVYGSLKLSWSFIEMSAVYLIGAILAGIVSRYSASKIAEELLEGGKAIFIGAIAVGIARSIQVILEQGNIIDSFIHYITNILDGLSPFITSVALFFIQTLINFFIPSGSGQAMATLPILIPAADLVGINRQICILAYQLGDGLSNLCYPTVGALIAFLIYSKVPFSKWIKYIMPLMIIMWTLSMVFIFGAVAINYGPF